MGAVGSVLNMFEDYTFNHKVDYEKDILKTECETLMKDFFKFLRNKKEEKLRNHNIKTLHKSCNHSNSNNYNYIYCNINNNEIPNRR